MGATWISWRTTTTAIFAILQIQGLISVKTTHHTLLTSVEGSHRDRILQQNFSRANSPQNLTRYITPIPPKDLKVDKLHLPLYVTAVMCVAAILSVCLFTLGLLLAVKHKSPRLNRETSSDYETMMPGVRTEPEHRCSCSDPDCNGFSALPPPTPDLCSHCTSKHRESTATLGLGDYVDVDIPGHICQYQNLDLGQLEEHVYHSLHRNNKPKDGPLEVKEQITC